MHSKKSQYRIVRMYVPELISEIEIKQILYLLQNRWKESMKGFAKSVSSKDKNRMGEAKKEFADTKKNSYRHAILVFR